MLQPFRRKGCDRSQEADSDDSSDDDLAASYERSRRLAAQREEHERLFKTAVHELGADHIRRHALFAQFCEKVEDTFNIAQARREAETSAHAGLFSRDQLISLAQEAEASRDEREAKSMAACEARAQRLFEEQKQRFQQTRDSVRCYCRTRGAVRFAVEAFGNATQQLGASARLDFASEYRLPVELNHHGEPVLSTGVPSTTSEEAALPAAEDTEGYNSPTNSRTVNTVACSEDEFSGLQQARSGTWTAMLARHAEALDAFDRAYHNLQTRLSSSSRNTESANSIVKDAICLRFQTAEIRRWNEMRALWRRHVRVMEQELWDPDMVRRTWVPRISHACTPCKRAKMKCVYPDGQDVCHSCQTGNLSHECVVHGRGRSTTTSVSSMRSLFFAWPTVKKSLPVVSQDGLHLQDELRRRESQFAESQARWRVEAERSESSVEQSFAQCLLKWNRDAVACERNRDEAASRMFGQAALDAEKLAVELENAFACGQMA